MALVRGFLAITRPEKLCGGGGDAGEDAGAAWAAGCPSEAVSLMLILIILKEKTGASWEEQGEHLHQDTRDTMPPPRTVYRQHDGTLTFQGWFVKVIYSVIVNHEKKTLFASKSFVFMLE